MNTKPVTHLMFSKSSYSPAVGFLDGYSAANGRRALHNIKESWYEATAEVKRWFNLDVNNLRVLRKEAGMRM